MKGSLYAQANHKLKKDLDVLKFIRQQRKSEVVTKLLLNKHEEELLKYD